MAVLPKIPKAATSLKTCAKCGRALIAADNFSYTHSCFYPDHYLPICNSCVDEYLKEHEYSWQAINKLCQWADIPFIVREWTRLQELNSIERVWPVYSKVFADQVYEEFGWADYNDQYKKLREAGQLQEELPLIHEKHMDDLRKKWGSNYSDEELYYLEDLYKGLLVSQNVNGALQIDQAQKICKLSLEINTRIRAGDKDVDKFLSSYDKLVKTAEFTPKNTKNAVDFDSFAEVGMWLEKRGRQNKFYDGTTRDVIDETLKNIESYNQRLYINEGGIGDEITQRIKSLQNANAMEESVYNIQQEYDLDEYDNDGYTMEEQEEFNIGLEDDVDE